MMIDRNIIVTRPAEQAERLAARLRSEGANPIVFPAIEIVHLDGAIATLAGYDAAIFISANAVTHGLRAIGRPPAAAIVIAVGRATAAALTNAGIAEVRSPADRFDSEGVLAMPELANIGGKRIAVVRGVGGRETLATELRRRGASVDYIECYARRRPATDARPLLALWHRAQVDAVSFTSIEGIDNFREMIGAAGRVFLAGTPAFVPHARIAAHARAAGVRKVIETAPGDEALVRELRAFFATVESRVAPATGIHPCTDAS